MAIDLSPFAAAVSPDAGEIGRRRVKRPSAFSSAPAPGPPLRQRLFNATNDDRGMPRTLTKWQLSQLWCCRRAIVADWFEDCRSPGGGALDASAPGFLQPRRQVRARYRTQRYAARHRSASKNPVRTKVNPSRKLSSGTTFAISFSLSVSSLLSADRRFAPGGRGASARKAAMDDRVRPASSMRPIGPEVFRDPGADHRFGGRPHVELRVELSRHPFDDDHGLLQHHQLDPGGHLEQAR